MEEMKEEKKVVIKGYGTKEQLLVHLAKNRGKNFMFEFEVIDVKTGDVVNVEQKIVYEKYVDLETKYIIDRYDEHLIYYPETNTNIAIVLKSITADIEDDDWTVKTAKGSTKRTVNDLRN